MCSLNTTALARWGCWWCVFPQDMCVVCGSFGLGAEGRLLACAQCGQCYHPFCVGIKVTMRCDFLFFSHPYKSKAFFSTWELTWMCDCCIDRSLRWCSVKAGVAWSAQCARPAAKPRILAACCCVTTVTSATTLTAWIPHCRMCPKTAGSANGKPSLTLFNVSLDPLDLDLMKLPSFLFLHRCLGLLIHVCISRYTAVLTCELHCLSWSMQGKAFHKNLLILNGNNWKEVER